MIEFRNVTKTYPGGTTAVRDFSLTVPRGQFTVLLGSSGCGKTTLLRMVNRMVEPTTGSVWVDGEDVATKNPVELRRSIGYALQAGGLLPHRTAADNVATVPLLLGVPKARARERAVELLERVGLDPSLAARYPSQLSGGQAQRVGVARALAADPKILLLDEPFGAVDPVMRSELQRQLLSLHGELGTTILLVTHDVDEALLLGDQVLLLRDGAEIVQSGTPEDFVRHPANQFVRDFLGLDSARRRFQVREVDGRDIVVDGDGRPAGVLAP